MTQYDHTQPSGRYGGAEIETSVDSLIRPCIRQAFPLPLDSYPTDERFRRLLEALAQLRDEAS
jgi:hypothetical protein